MIWRRADTSELFRQFAAYVIRHSAIDFHPHKIADLMDEIEVQRECGGPWTVFELDRLEAEADNFDDADLLSCFADVPQDEVCREVPEDSVIGGRRLCDDRDAPEMPRFARQRGTLEFRF